MKSYPVGFAIILLSLSLKCRGSEVAEKGVKPSVKTNPAAKPVAKKLDSTVASIRVEPEKDGYRFFLQPKDKNVRMESRCFRWTLDSLPGSKEISRMDYQESNCNDQSYKLEELAAAISWVGKDSSRIAKNYGEEFLHWFSMAKNPILFLESIQYHGGTNRFMELPLGETVATLTFHSDDTCENQSDVNTGCEKRVLPPPTVGEVQLKIKINVKEGQFEIR